MGGGWICEIKLMELSNGVQIKALKFVIITQFGRGEDKNYPSVLTLLPYFGIPK